MQLAASSGRQALSGDVRCPLGGLAAPGLSSKYFAMADDSTLSKTAREAAECLKLAHAALRVLKPDECLPQARDAFAKFGEMGDEVGQTDAMSLLVSALLLQADLSSESYQSVLERSLEEESKASSDLSKACMRLSVTELRASSGHESELATATQEIEKARVFFKGNARMLAKVLPVAVSIYFQRRCLEQTRKAASEAEELYKAKIQDDPIGKARALHCVALSRAALEDFEGAIKYAKQALQCYEQPNSGSHSELAASGAAFEMRVIAMWYILAEQPHKALRYAKDAVIAQQQLKANLRSEAAAVLLYVEALVRNSRQEQALREAEMFFQKAVFRSGDDPVGIVSANEVMMHTHLFIDSPGELPDDPPAKARQAAEAALSAARDAHNRRLELSCLYGKIEMDKKYKQYARANTTFDDVMAVTQAMDDSEEEAQALYRRSVVCLTAPEADELVSHGSKFASQARTLFEKLGCKCWCAYATILTAFAHLADNDVSEAFSALNEAQLLSKNAGDRAVEADVLRLHSQVHADQGQVSEAMEKAEECVALRKKLGMKRAQASAIHHLASVYMLKKLQDDAEAVIRVGLALCKDVGAKELEVNLWLQLTQVLIGKLSEQQVPGQKGDETDEYKTACADASDAVKKALVLSARFSDSSLRSAALFWRSELLLWTLRGAEALESAKEAEESFQKTGNQKGAAHTNVLMADLHFMLGKLGEAKETAEKALEFAKSTPDGEDLKGPATAVLDKIAAQEKAKSGKKRRGGRTKWVKKWVNERRLVSGGGGGQVAKLNTEATIKKVGTLVKDVMVDDSLEFDAFESFMDMGIDSLATVQLTTSIAKEFQIQVAPSVLFDYPNASSLAEYIAEAAEESSGGGGGGGEEQWEDHWVEKEVEVDDDDDDDDDLPVVRAVEAAPAAQAAQSAAAVVSAKPALDVAVVSKQVRALVLDSVADDDENIVLDTPFMEAGIDSLGSVQLVTSCAKTFQLSMAPSVVFDFPSIRELANHIVAESADA